MQPDHDVHEQAKTVLHAPFKHPAAAGPPVGGSGHASTQASPAPVWLRGNRVRVMHLCLQTVYLSPTCADSPHAAEAWEKVPTWVSEYAGEDPQLNVLGASAKGELRKRGGAAGAGVQQSGQHTTGELRACFREVPAA
jgi:hypothetical protein